MKKKISYKQRVEKTRESMKKNGLFLIIVVIICSFFLITKLTEKKTNEPKVVVQQPNGESIVLSDDTDEEKLDKEQDLFNTPTDKGKWTFYWSDLIVLVVGSGICTVMIIKERKKAKEELR